MLIRSIIAAIACLVAAPVLAQTGSIKTPAQMNGEINALFPNNTVALITPANARQVTLDTVASVSFLNTANIFSAYQAINLNSGSLPTPQSGTAFQIGNATSAITRVELDSFGSASHFTGMRSEGSAAAPTAVLSGSEIASFNAGGYNSSAWVEPRAAFRCYANQTWSAGANGTYCDVAVTANGATAQAESIRFENDGGITIPSTVSGGDKGAGTINAGGIFINGTAAIPFNGNIGAATGTSLVLGPVDLVPGPTNRLNVSSTTATSSIAVGQTTSNFLAFLWNYNATVGSATASIQTGGFTNSLAIDASTITFQGLSGGSVNFGANSFALGGAFSTAAAYTMSGAFSFTGTVTGATNVTFPTTGTLATLAGSEILSNKTLVAPALGTPASGTATNLSGTAASLTAGHVTTNANMTGDVTSVGNATTLAAGSASNLNSGTLNAARMPALTGDCTTSAGAVATTCLKTNGTSFGTIVAQNYTQGTWTPGVTAAVAGVPAYTLQVGSYEQIGRQITARFTIVLSGWTGSPSGAVSITGLPITSANTASDFGSCVVADYASMGLATTGVTGIINPNSTSVTLLQGSTSTVATISQAQFGTTSTAIGVCQYHS